MTSYYLRPSDDDYAISWVLNGLLLPGADIPDSNFGVSPLAQSWLNLPEGVNLEEILQGTSMFQLELARQRDPGCLLCPSLLWDNGYVVNLGLDTLDGSFCLYPENLGIDFDPEDFDPEDLPKSELKVFNEAARKFVANMYGYPEDFTNTIQIKPRFFGATLGIDENCLTRTAFDYTDEFNVGGCPDLEEEVGGVYGEHLTPEGWVYTLLTAAYITGNMSILNPLMGNREDLLNMLDLHYSVIGTRTSATDPVAPGFFECYREPYAFREYPTCEEYLDGIQALVNTPKFHRALEIIQSTDYTSG